MRKPVSGGMLYAPKLSTRFDAQETKEPAMKKVSTAAGNADEEFSRSEADDWSGLGYCVDLNGRGGQI